MPYKAKGKCVYKKDTGKKVGCTKGPVKKYLAALHANVKTETKKKKPKFKDFHEMQMGTLGASRNVGDFSHVAESTFADGQDETVPSVQPIADAASKDEVVKDIIADLEELENAHDWSTPVNDDILQGMANTLKEIGIEPTDIVASIGKPVELQRRFLIDGPSSWKGGNGALNDLRNILQGNEPQEVTEDESDPASDLAMGSTSAGDTLSEGVYKIGQVLFNNPYGTGKKYFPGVDKIEAASEDDALNKYIRRIAAQKNIPTNPAILYKDAKKNGAKVVKLEEQPPKEQQFWWQDFDESYEKIMENFIDKKGPGRPGDSKRHGIKKGSSLTSLDKIVKSKSASPRKKQLAHWQANMRRGKAKKSR